MRNYFAKTSLRNRLLISAFCVLIIFLGLTGAALENAFQRSLEDSIEQRLQAHVFTLISATNISDDGGLTFAENLPDVRFNTPGSGLYAEVWSPQQQKKWRSLSLFEQNVAFLQEVASGQWQFKEVTTLNGRTLLVMNYGVVWELESGQEQKYIFSVAEEEVLAMAGLDEFRRNLWLSLSAVMVLLLFVQWWLLNWGLNPLKRLTKHIQAIEEGDKRELEGDFPGEIQGLVTNLNHLLEHEALQRERYRNSLSDLAHSLKTPLAVMTNLLDQQSSEVRPPYRQELERMNQIISHQLQRAVLTQPVPFAAKVAVAPVARRVLDALQKVYRGKDVSLEVELNELAVFQGDEADLMECLGNLFDNAFKYSRSQIRVQISDDKVKKQLEIQIEDDGPGVSQAWQDTIIERGVRADTSYEGQGIGLAVVCDMIRAYNGSLEIGQSKTLGGASFKVSIPQRG